MDVREATAWVTLAVVGAFAGVIVIRIILGQIDVTRIISEPTGDASMSRFQLLIFTFVVALGLILVTTSASPPAFPDIPGGVLTLLGISASSYVVSKSIQFSKPGGIEDRPPVVTVSPSAQTLHPGETVTFKADVRRTTNTAVKWAVVPPGIGTINPDTGVYTAPAQVPPAGAIVNVQAVSVADAQGVGTAVVNLVTP